MYLVYGLGDSSFKGINSILPNNICNMLPVKISARLYVWGLKTDSKMYVEIQKAKKSKDKWTGGGTLPDIMFYFKVTVSMWYWRRQTTNLMGPQKGSRMIHHTIYNNDTAYHLQPLHHL